MNSSQKICLIWAPSTLQISAAPRAVGNAAASATKYINLVTPFSAQLHF